MESQFVEEKSRNILLLTCILIAVFVVPTSISGTAIALPAINAELHSQTAELQWVVNAFNLTFASFTLAWGGIADVFGGKRSFISGAGLYFIASLLSWNATNIYILDAARALAGIGGAAIFSCGSAILIQTFNGIQRTRAFALFGTTAGLGITLGPTLSGWLLDVAGWRDIFIVHAIALLIVLMLAFSIPAALKKTEKLALDIVGILLFILTLFLLMSSITQGAERGWNDSFTLSLLGSGLIFLLLFVAVEKRSPNPMVNFTLLTNHYFLSMILIPVVASFSFVTLLTWFPTWLISIKSLSPFDSGLVMLALTSPVLILPIIAAKLVTRGIRAELLLVTSLVLFVGGLLLLWTFNQGNISIAQILISLLLVGAGMGLSAGLVDGVALSVVSSHEVGRAAGILNTFRLGSEAIAVAIYGSLMSIGIFRSLDEKYVPEGISAHQYLADVVSGNAFSSSSMSHTSWLEKVYTNAFSDTLLVLLVISLILSIAIMWMMRKKNV
ncbi:MFS transporter [Serratia microhaemolytica]|uniref:MFS transporter n=1 Tax=Serratia microhaemolytica TaxID=2675110 RepID=UPI000FDEBBDB|nr:MFS transporter [Serratia microhaemolytica]